MSIGHSIISKITDPTKIVIINNTDANLGHFSVSLTSQNADPIAQASALQYHEVDVDSAQAFHKKFVLLKKRVGKSKFAKKSLEDEEIDDDPDVDEATGEGAASNDSKYQRIINAHLVKLAQNNALHADIYRIL